MKLIEALKGIKELSRKHDDLCRKIHAHSAHLSNETPVYEDQKKQVSEWLQAQSDILKEILRLRIAIQRTNLDTMVTIEIGDKAVEKSIAEWIHRRRDLATAESKAWRALTDRNLSEGTITQSTGETVEIKLVRHYNPQERDIKTELFVSEPTIIDGRLEVVNATTDLIE